MRRPTPFGVGQRYRSGGDPCRGAVQRPAIRGRRLQNQDSATAANVATTGSVKWRRVSFPGSPARCLTEAPRVRQTPRTMFVLQEDAETGFASSGSIGRAGGRGPMPSSPVPGGQGILETCARRESRGDACIASADLPRPCGNATGFATHSARTGLHGGDQEWRRCSTYDEGCPCSCLP